LNRHDQFARGSTLREMRFRVRDDERSGAAMGLALVLCLLCAVAYVLIGLPAAAGRAMTSASIAARSIRRFPMGAGRWRRVDRHLENSARQIVQWRGYSAFLLFARYLNGEDITPVLASAADFNVLRVFGEANRGFNPQQYGVPDYTTPGDRADFDAKLGAFFDLAARYGFHVEYSVLTYGTDVPTMRAKLQRVYDIAASHPNVIVQGGNEAEANGIDIVQVYQGVDRHGVLSDYGLDPERHCADQAAISQGAWTACELREVHVLDFGTTHDLARDFDHSPRMPRDALDWQDMFDVPFVSDEPIGFIDPGTPHFRQTGTDPTGAAFYGYESGGGTRTTNCDIIESAAAIAALYTPGYTFHSQAGLEGRWPSASEPLTAACTKRLADLWAFLPASAQLGRYTHPGGAGYPLAWTPGDTDSRIGHAYASMQDQVGYVVVPMLRPGVSLKPVGGWRIDAVAHVPYVVRVAR
jgi:hypothetical protein